MFFMVVVTAMGQTNKLDVPSATNIANTYLQQEVVTNYSRTPISIGSRPTGGCSQIGCLVCHCESIDSPTDYNETETVIKKTLLKYDTGNHKGEVVLDQEELSKRTREVRQKTFMQTNEWKKVEEIKWMSVTNTLYLTTNMIYFTSNMTYFATNNTSWNFVLNARNLTKEERDYYNARADAMRVLPWGSSVEVIRQEVETIDSLRDIQNRMAAITNSTRSATNARPTSQGASIYLSTNSWQTMTNRPDKQEETY
jgi:hypothetical protein